MADAEVKARIRLIREEPGLLRAVATALGGDFSTATFTANRAERRPSTETFPCKEFSIVDDMLTVSDSASVSISNPDGVHSDKFFLGQRVEIDESDPDVANGQWVRMFTGRIVGLNYASDVQGGSVIQVDAMDLGWHLTSCDATPLTQTARGTIAKLIENLVHPSWGFETTTTGGLKIDDNVLNRTLKQGRQGVARLFVPPKTILPFIQVEPGQKPFDVLRTYLTREGVLLNVSARGGIVLFRPDYEASTPYAGAEYHPISDPRRSRSNVLGRPTLSMTIDGVYSEVQCWSTTVKPTRVQSDAIAVNPNAVYRKHSYKLDPNPLPFERLCVAMDSEAITPEMRKNRAVWKAQMDEFNSWRYEVELRRHSQRGAFIVSDTMFPLVDTLHKVDGTFYVQQVRRSVSLDKGERVKLILRQPIIDPTLQKQLGGGAKKAAKR